MSAPRPEGINETAVTRLIQENSYGVRRHIVGVWNVGSLEPERLAELRQMHEPEYVYAADYDALLSEVSRLRADGATPFKCAAKRTADPPQDCDWPFCGCDEKASRVVSHLVEMGWKSGAGVTLAINDATTALKADGATLKVRADEALAAHSASFGALQTLSAALFDGEVDDYAALAEKVIARVRQAESDGATLRERVKALEEEANYLTSRLDDVEGCGARAGGFECTAPKGHRGDHIAHETEGREVHRWPTTASAPKEPTPHVHATMGASGPCTICGVPVRCSNLKDGQATCDEPNVYCAHPKCLQPKEPTPHAVRETGWLIEHSQEGLLKYWSPSSTEHRTWVIDPWQAVRFSRREDAERVKVALNYAFSAVIEHAFIPKEPTPHG